MPRFTVALSTFGRGQHIVPTIRSVLAQTFADFELLIVGDGCTDGTQAAVEPFLGPRVAWYNLPERGGSQSFPNNAAIERAQGDLVAYVGHDDIWAPDHLERLDTAFREAPETGFAVSGCLYYGPPGSNVWLATGLFDGDEAKFEHFFPPASIAHRREVAAAIGGWRPPAEIVAPVDSDFMLRSAHAGFLFRSTCRVTVHKFAAGHRYLSYVRQSSIEQEAMLADMAAPDFEARVAKRLDAARAAGTFMSMRHPRFEAFSPGELAARNDRNKGLSRPPLRQLEGEAVITQDDGPRAFDWRPFDAGEKRVRWSFVNPRPKMLISFACTSMVRVRAQVTHHSETALRGLALHVNDVRVPLMIGGMFRNGDLWEATAEAIVRLHDTEESIAELVLPPQALPGADRKGIGVAEIGLAPLLDVGAGGASPFDAIVARVVREAVERREVERPKVAAKPGWRRVFKPFRQFARALKRLLAR